MTASPGHEHSEGTGRRHHAPPREAWRARRLLVLQGSFPGALGHPTSMEQETLLTLGRDIKVSGSPGLTHSRVCEGMEGAGGGVREKWGQL